MPQPARWQLFMRFSSSQKSMTCLHMRYMSVVFEQALYCKVTEILWAHRDSFPNNVPRLGVFHTICMFLGVIGKHFRDAGLRDVCIESGTVAEGSVNDVLDGHKYNRSLRFHKLMYEALLRLVWDQFSQWLREPSWCPWSRYKYIAPRLECLFWGYIIIHCRRITWQCSLQKCLSCSTSVNSCNISGLSTVHWQASGCHILTWWRLY